MTTNPVATINVHQLKTLLDTDPNLCLIDVRELEEWQSIHIEQAIHIPKDELATRIEETGAKHDQPIYLYCKGGVRSYYAAQTLMAMGFKQVYSVEGGIIAWVQMV